MRDAEISLLINCTSRKRRPPMPELRARTLPTGDLLAISGEWVSRLKEAKYQFVAGHLYCGRAVTETLEAGKLVGGEVAFLSAGLGIIEQFQKVPAYSLTASTGYPDSVSNRITGPYDAASWWRALAKAQRVTRPLTRFIESGRRQLTLLAAPTGYLEMVADDLADLSTKSLRTLRIIGPRRQEEVDKRLRANWLPYDGRLDNPKTGMNGTASDFPHRALRHFVAHVLPRDRRGSCESHACAVDEALSRFKTYIRPRGQSACDDTVSLAIAHVWKKHDGCRSRILRELRSDMNIACEQSRFRRLANQVEAKLNAT